jgi:SAM-dependent methyltransferase
MPIYQQYAPYYNQSGKIRFSLLTHQYLQEILAKHPIAGKRQLDLACGTGTLALMQAEQGWQVVGVDLSEAMLQQARQRNKTQGNTQGHFIQADICQLPTTTQQIQQIEQQYQLHWCFDLVTCCYDSLNYLLSEAELAQCFAGVAAALQSGGLFYGDMNTISFLQYDWPDVEVSEQRNLIQVSQSSYDQQTDCSAMKLTGFIGNDRDGYLRFDETHIERGYPAERIALLLEQAGLRVEASYDCFTMLPISEKTQRIAWIARKP